MIFPALIKHLLGPLLDWSLATGVAVGHVLLGTLCAIPRPGDNPDVQ